MCTCGRKKLPFAGYSVVKDLEASSCQRSAASHLERRLRDELLSKTFLAQTFGPPSPLRGAKVGGEYRARTGDLLVANQALSQLS
jgi:hypothetical protein